MKNISQIIKDLRLAIGWSQKDFAAKVGTTQAILSKVEDGKLEPSFSIIEGLVLHFNLDITKKIKELELTKAEDSKVEND